MLADIHVRVRLLVGVIEALETSIWNTLLVLGPGNALGVEQIRNRGDVGWEEVEIVVVHAEVVTGSSSAVIGLAGMSCSEVLAQGDPLAGKVLQVWVASGGAVVDVLQPYLVEALECLALHVRDGREHWRGSLSSLDGRERRLNG